MRSFNCGVIGYGPVGRELVRVLESHCCDVRWIRRSDGFYDKRLRPNKSLERAAVQAVFIAVPSTGKGEIALSYMLPLLRAGIPVITCEKASLANHFAVLRPHLDRLRFNASVGGNCGAAGLLLREREKVIEISGSVNATLSVMRRLLIMERTFEEACEYVRDKKFTEQSGGDILGPELRDVLLKQHILFHLIERKHRIRLPRVLPAVSSPAFAELSRKGLACVFRIAKSPPTKISNLSEQVYERKAGPWHLSIGFTHPGLMSFPAPNGNQAVVSWRTAFECRTIVWGQAAGPAVVAGQMITDAFELLSR